MNKRDALRLKPGAEVTFGEGPSSYDSGRWWVGEVIRVTPRGGVLVRITQGRSHASTWGGPGTGPNVGEERWVRYDRIVSG